MAVPSTRELEDAQAKLEAQWVRAQNAVQFAVNQNRLDLYTQAGAESTYLATAIEIIKHTLGDRRATGGPA